MNVYQELGIFHCALTFFGTALLQIAGLQPLGCRHSHQGSSAVYWPLMRHLTAVIQAIAAAALFGLAAPLSKLLLERVNTFQLAGLLYLGAALGLLPALAVGGRLGSILRIDRRNRLKVAGAVVFGGVLGPVLLLLGLRTAQASSVSLLLNLELVATALLGVLLFKDHLTASGWLAVAGVLTAGALVSLPEGSAGLLPALWIAAACACWGMDNHLTALIDGITPVQSTFLKGTAAGTFNLLLGLALHPALPAAGPLAATLALGAVSYGASIVLYISAAQTLGATRGQLAFASAPFFGMLFSLLLLSEALTGLRIAAAAILVASIALMSLSRHLHAHRHEPVEHVHRHSHDDDHHTHAHPEGSVSLTHLHRHRHEPVVHTHPHAPDLHHRHSHRNGGPGRSG